MRFLARAVAACRRTQARAILPLTLTLLAPCARGAPPGVAAQDLPPRAVERVPFVRLDPRTAQSGPGGEAREARERRRQVETARRLDTLHRTLGPHRVSRRGLAELARRGLGPARLPTAEVLAEPAAQVADTLHVLIVRIGFETDRSGDLTSVTTDGNFLLAPDPAARIDPPPHDKAYFESHLYGLSEFYRCQSGGRLVIDGLVLPQGTEDCYRLGDLADYGPGAGAWWTFEKLESLVRDMIGAADAGMSEAGLDLSAWSDDDPFTYVIFVHAGADWQSDIYNDSPNDVPTFFVTLGVGESLLGGGILSECSVIPETTTQDGYLGSIAAALYHEFGHALGLVDIYDTYTGLPRAGIWTLMDSGTNLSAVIGFPTPTPANPDSVEIEFVTGLLPPSLGAWDKWFLGWLEAQPARGAWTELALPAVQVLREDYERYRQFGYAFDEADPQALIGGVSTREFFLVENRWVPLGPGELPDSSLALVRDEQTGVVLYLAGDDPDGGGPLPPRNTGMYDYFLPDGGLLVWHVNQARIEPSLADNTINIDGDGLRLIEADGIQDIGVLESYVLGFYGSARDPFHAGRDGSPVTSVALAQEGAPASRAYDRSWTGFLLEDISPNEAVMTLRAMVAPTAADGVIELPPYDAADAVALGGQPGPRALEATSVTPIEFPGGGGLLLADAPDPAWGDSLFTAWGATLFAVRPSGDAVAAPPAGLPLGAIHRFGAALAGPPALLADGDEVLAIVGARDGEVSAFRTTDAPDDAVALAWTARVGAALPWAPARAGETGTLRLLCLIPPDSLRSLDVGGNLSEAALSAAEAGDFALPPLALGLPTDATAWAVFGARGWFVAANAAGGAPPQLSAATEYGFEPGVAPAGAAIIPRAEGPLVVVAGEDGSLRAWRATDAGGQSLAWATRLEAAPAGELAVADLDADGHNDLIVITAERVHAFNAGGVALRGYPARLSELFPLAADVRLAGPVVVCDTAADGRNELLATTTRGHLIGLDATGRLLPRTPFLWGGEPVSALIAAPTDAAAGRTLWLADAGGRTAPPLARRWLPGRLAGYRFPDWVGVGEGTSEWLGPAGGPARDGPVGAARLLAAVSPLLDERERVVLYPNPARDGRVTVRFWSETAEPAHASLHDLAGELVARVAMPAQAGAINEYVWSLPHLASGLYLVRVDASGAAGRRRWLTRLAVER